MKHLFVLFMAFVLTCCSRGERISTPGQEEQYNACRESFGQHAELLSTITAENDSAGMVVNDVKELDIEDFIEKHKLKQQDIDPMPQSLNITRQVLEAFDKPDGKLKN